MASASKKAAAKKPAAPKFVTEERFEKLETGVNTLLDKMEAFMTQPKDTATATPGVIPAPVETVIDKEIKKAGANDAPINPAWEEKAKEIIGEAVDHCEVAYLRNGGVIFTIVIKTEMSNAPKDYLDRMGQDRRSKEVGSEGIEGVENWCKLVKANLARPR